MLVRSALGASGGFLRLALIGAVEQMFGAVEQVRGPIEQMFGAVGQVRQRGCCD